MTTPVFITGWEHGVSPVTSGGGLASAVTGTPTVVSTIKRSGTYSIQFNPSAATEFYWAPSLATPTVCVGRIYVYFHSWNGVDNDIVFSDMTAAGTNGNPGIKIRSATHKCYARFWGLADGNEANLALALDTWYRIDYKFDVSANPSTIDFQVAKDDGSAAVAAAQSTYAQAATTLTTPGVGATNSDTCEFYVDDWTISTTAGDYPIGDSVVVGLSPNADGTHVPGTDVMEDASGNDIGAVTAYNLLDDVPLSTGGAADRVQQTANGTGNYAEVVFASIPSASSVKGAIGLLAYQSASTSSNQGATIMSHDAFSSSTEIFGNPTTRADMSESSEFYKSVVITAPGGGWTGSETLKARIGYSGDANPDPYWDALMIEVDYVPGAPPAGQPMYHRFGGMPGRTGVQAQAGRSW